MFRAQKTALILLICCLLPACIQNKSQALGDPSEINENPYSEELAQTVINGCPIIGTAYILLSKASQGALPMPGDAKREKAARMAENAAKGKYPVDGATPPDFSQAAPGASPEDQLATAKRQIDSLEKAGKISAQDASRIRARIQQDYERCVAGQKSSQPTQQAMRSNKKLKR